MMPRLTLETSSPEPRAGPTEEENKTLTTTRVAKEALLTGAPILNNRPRLPLACQWEPPSRGHTTSSPGIAANYLSKSHHAHTLHSNMRTTTRAHPHQYAASSHPRKDGRSLSGLSLPAEGVGVGRAGRVWCGLQWVPG